MQEEKQDNMTGWRLPDGNAPQTVVIINVFTGNPDGVLKPFRPDGEDESNESVTGKKEVLC